ncbi:MAG: hypothetical protein FWH22_11365, partial [Fibromonadales bacterium]|nr:hypothetical protein [Fibromonadales bacterium]
MKRFTSVMLMLLASFIFLGCSINSSSDDINWNGDNSGTLELFNGSNKDMIVFIGQSPSESSILGGIRANATRLYDVSKHVDDFAIGGYTIIRGVTKERYDAEPDPTKVKIEFTAMVTYRSGAKYRYNIDPNYMGDYGFRIGNRGRIGMELRKDSPHGEKIAYLPALQQNQMVYADNTNAITLFPVYVFFNRNSGEVSTLSATSLFETV